MTQKTTAPEKRHPRQTYRYWLALALLSSACLAAYFNSIGGGFVFDDSTLVQTDDRIQKLSNIPRMLNPFSASYLTYRPIRTISYAIDYHFSQYDPAGYHIANIVYHAACTFLVFLIALQFLSNWIFALLAGALFALHPVHTEAVSYISGRRDLLSTLFFLLAFWLYTRYREKPATNALIGVFVFFALGVLSKEMAVTLPAILLLYDWFLEIRSGMQGTGTWSWKAGVHALGRLLRRHWLVYGLGILFALFFVYYYLYITPASTNLSIYWGGSLYTNFLTAVKIHAKYLQLIFFPITLIADYNSGQVFPLANRLSDPTVFLPLLLVMTAMLGSLWLFLMRPGLGFGAVFFFITLLPVSHIIPHHELMSEHYLYLPSVGFCLLFSSFLELFPHRGKRWAWTAGAAAMLVLALYAGRTVVRNRDWNNEFTLWSATLRDAPLSVRAHTNLGLVYLSRNDLERAIAHFQNSLAIPSKPELGTLSQGRALQNLGVAYYRKKEYEKALECYRKCLELDPRNYVSYINMGVVYNAQGRNDDAIEAYRKALEINPVSKEALLNLAIGYTRKRNYDAALREYEHLIQVDRGTDLTARAHFNMGLIFYYYLKDFPKASYRFEIARRMDPVKYATERWLGKPFDAEKIETPLRKDHQP